MDHHQEFNGGMRRPLFLFLAGGVAALTLYFLFLWWTGSEPQIAFVTGAMKHNTALSLFFLALGMMGLEWFPDPLGSRLLLLCSIPSLAVSGLTLLQYLTGWNLHLDEFFVKDIPGPESQMFPGRMSPIAATAFFVTSIGMLWISSRRLRRRPVHQWLGILVFLISYLAIIGYIYNVPDFYQVGVYIRIASYTAVCFLILATLQVFSVPRIGVARFVHHGHPIGQATCRLLLMAIILPPVIEVLCLRGYELGYYSLSQGLSFSVLLFMILFTLLIYQAGKVSYLASRERDRLLQEAQAAVRLRDQFLSIAGHELKTPITSMKLQAQFLRKKILDQTANFAPSVLVGTMETYDRQLNRLNRLVDDMLNISRLKSSKISLERTPTEINSLVRTSINQLEMFIQDARVSCVFHPSERTMCEIDPMRTHQVIENLIINAVKYGQGTPIEVRIEPLDPNRVAISVTDSGRGISTENQQRIFEQFERAVNESEVSGLGLGLYISKQFVEMQGGEINVRSELNRGATFTVILPTSPPAP